jgi:hypothetical protein
MTSSGKPESVDGLLEILGWQGEEEEEEEKEEEEEETDPVAAGGGVQVGRYYNS